MIRAILKAMSKRHMDVSLKSGPDLVVRIVERPGLWMTDEGLSALSADLRHVARKTLSAEELRYGVFAADKARMEQTIITLVARRDGTPVAFNALAVMDVAAASMTTDVLHLGLVMVDPDERSKSLSWVLYGLTCFLILLRRQLRPIWISNVTQVPAVVGMVSGMFSQVWPQPNGGRRSLNHLLLGREIMRAHRHVFGVGPDAGFDEDRFVITNAYTGGSDGLKKTFDEATKHREDIYNTFCEDALDYDRGDDVIQIGLMDIAAMRSFLLRDVPKGALLGLIIVAAGVTLQRLILPVLHWFDSKQSWSILRPERQREDV